MSDARVTSIAVEVIRKPSDTAGAGSSAGGATVVGASPVNNGRKIVVCVITN